MSIIGDHISDRIRAEEVYERDLLEMLRDHVLDLTACRDQVAIDVGANIGNHTLFFSDLFARVIAFEPNPLARSLLQINLELNRIRNVKVEPVALWDRAGRQLLTFDTANLGAARLNDANTGDELDERNEVELAVGDALVDPSEPIGLIKIDVEGAEEMVLRGLQLTIRKHRPIVVIEQLSDSIDPATGTSPPFIFLRNLGYVAHDPRLAGARFGRLARIISIVRGSATYHLEPIERLEKRNYSALLFLPIRGPDSPAYESGSASGSTERTVST